MSDTDLSQALSRAEAAAGIGTAQAATSTECYLDRTLTEGPQDMALAVLFDETKLALEFDVETTEPRGDPPHRICDVSIWCRTVVLFNEFTRVLIVDHFLSTIEPRWPNDPPGRWTSGKYDVGVRVLRQLGWELPYGPGEEPARRRQGLCRFRSEAIRTAVAAADEWILDVSTATAPVREEIEREQAVRVLAGEDLAGESTQVPI